MNEHAIIFDMDGVIVDSNPYHKIALNQFCAKHGYHLTEDDLRSKIYGRTNKEWITTLFGNLPSDQLLRYGEEKEALYRELFEKDIKPVDGLIDFLNLLDEYDIPRGDWHLCSASKCRFHINENRNPQFLLHHPG